MALFTWRVCPKLRLADCHSASQGKLARHRSAVVVVDDDDDDDDDSDDDDCDDDDGRGGDGLCRVGQHSDSGSVTQ